MSLVYSGGMTKSRLLLDKYKLISDQIESTELTVIIEELDSILERKVAGDVVELGCYTGTTSLFLRRVLDLHESLSELHVYDSFAGLPPKRSEDQSRLGEAFEAGKLRASRFDLQKQFKKAGLRLPVIHKGWFEELGADDLPQAVAFAFIDGDFFSSIMASLKLVWPHLSPGGSMVIDDYDNDKLPGVKRATDDFFGKRACLRVQHSLAIIKKD